ncbi:MAG: hypothetical protein LC789_10165 [Actinobacteria bacterium]|nr:hypothetical protein [Actinomycetota bacterium]
MASRRTSTLLIALFGVLMVASIVITGVFNHLLAGDPRVLVVTMTQTAGEADRELLKHDCGTLPGVTVVADAGNPSPDLQGRFPVRFGLAGATPAQEAALEVCIDKHHSIVRGLLTEGDR